MLITGRRAVIVAVGVTVVALGLLLGWFAAAPSGAKRIPLSDRTRLTAERAARTLQDLRDFRPMEDPAVVAECFAAADVRGPTDVSASDLTVVRRIATEFVPGRLAENSSPSAYADARMREGCVVNSDHALDRVWEVAMLFEMRRHGAAPRDRIEMFVDLASDDLEAEGPARRPVRMAPTGRGC